MTLFAGIVWVYSLMSPVILAAEFEVKPSIFEDWQTTLTLTDRQTIPKRALRGYGTLAGEFARSGPATVLMIQAEKEANAKLVHAKIQGV